MTKLPREGQGTAPAFEAFKGQGAVFHGLQKDINSGQGVHAYLLCGPKGIGKRTLARLAGQGFVCQGAAKPCGRCPECLRAADGNHPDITVVKSDKSIGVDAVREILRLTAEHTYEGGRRIIRIENAERMTLQAQNSLLKTLEEPHAETVFLLTCDDTTQLLPTIISRCRVLRLHPWPDAYVAQVLRERGVTEERIRQAVKVSGGSIGAALSVAEDEAYWRRRALLLQTVFSIKGEGMICQVSAQFKEDKDAAEDWLGAVEEMIREVMLVRLGQGEVLALSEYPAPWQEAARQAPPETFERLLTAIFDTRRLRASQVNWQAALEKLLLSITEEMKLWQQ